MMKPKSVIKPLHNSANGLRPGEPIFHSQPSIRLWDAINHSKTVSDLRDALYLAMCHCQNLESRLEHLEERLKQALDAAS